MAVSRQHRVHDGKIRCGIAKMDIAPISNASKFMPVIANQDLTSVQITVNKRIA